MPSFGTSSAAKLATCADDLRMVMQEAIRTSPVDFSITCGHRGQSEQDRCCAAGLSKTPWPTSKHNHAPSLAVDVAPYINGRIEWGNIEAFRDIAHHILSTADRLGVALRWGGDWDGNPDTPNRFNDIPHFELKG